MSGVGLNLRLLAIASAALIASEAHGQGAGPDGAWLDRAGRYTMIQFGGGQPAPLQPGGRALPDFLGLFRDACLDRPFSANEPHAAVQARDWGFKQLEASVPSGKVSADLSGWQASDVSVRSSTGVFFAPNPQCNVTAALGQPIDADTLENALTTLIGSAPVNADKKLNSKGERRGSYEPTWTVSGPGGKQRTVYARVVREGAAIRLHLAALEPKEK